MPVDMNSVTTNDCHQLEVLCCCCAGVLQFSMSCPLWHPEPATISGNTSSLPHFLVPYAISYYVYYAAYYL